MSLRQIALNNHRNVFFLSVTTAIAPFALRPESTIYPLIGLLSALLIYTPILFRVDTSFRKQKIALLIGLLSAGSCVFRYKASSHALSTSGTSHAALLGASTTLSVLTVAAIGITTRTSTRLTSSWSRVTLFPAVWATLWCTFSYINPVGHLATWTPADNVDAYNWLAPYLGPAGKDWIVAAWAVVISETITQWFMEENEGEYTPLLGNSSSRNSSHSNKTATRGLAAVLVALLIPYSISSNSPLPISDVDVATPVSVGCVLPSFLKYQKHTLSLNDYIAESKTIAGSARIILWPEGAVTFKSAEERESAFEEIRKNVTGAYIGVSFEETVTNPDDPTGRQSITRTGLAVLSARDTKPLLTYYKRHLVPVAESYRLDRSTSKPTLVEVELPRPTYIPKEKWGPEPNFKNRPLSITSSICLDFAFPSPFEALEGRPGLILAPARTWEPTVGSAMWLQAKQRATELGSMILWCDGGEGGVSGVAGGGFNDVTQVGSGSFTRTIAISHPFDPKRTFYARFGELSLVLFWILVMGNPRNAIEFVRAQLAARNRKKSDSQSLAIQPAQERVDLLG